MPTLLALFLTALTLPLCAGALGAVIGGAFSLPIIYSIPFLVIGGVLLLAAARA